MLEIVTPQLHVWSQRVGERHESKKQSQSRRSCPAALRDLPPL